MTHSGSPPWELAVRGATVVRPEGAAPLTVAIAGGRIAALLEPDAPLAGTRVLDATGLHLFPGGIDCHVHFRDPGMPEAEDFASGSAAALAGGVTTVLDMPNTEPPTTTLAAFQAKARAAAERGRCDVRLFAGITTGNLEELDAMAEAGAAGFKCYMAPSTGGLTFPGRAGFVEALRVAARRGLRVALHAEDDDLVRESTARLRQQGETAAEVWTAARPAEAETRALEVALEAAQATGAALHLCHLSTRAALDLLPRFRSAGVDVTTEVTPHHALLDRRAYARLGVAARVNPPLREPEDAAALFEALAGGVIDCFASDHAPHPASAKAAASVWDGASGFSGVQLLLPLLITQAVEGRLSLERVAEATAAAPARIWRLRGKGALAPGSAADLALFDLGQTVRVEPGWLKGRSTNVAFDGFELRAVPVYTLVAGDLRFSA